MITYSAGDRFVESQGDSAPYQEGMIERKTGTKAP